MSTANDFGQIRNEYDNNSFSNSLNKKENITNYIISFSEYRHYCIGMVDMINSTKISAGMNQEKASRYYEIFLNSMSEIIGRFGGVVIKNMGDCLLYYFPETEKYEDDSGFMSCIECGMEMIENHGRIDKKTALEKLPQINYRISADFGKVSIMNSNQTNSIDLLGPPVNMCSKINHSASNNGMVVGGDLYEIVKKFCVYKFRQVKGYSIGFRFDYPIYSVSRD